MSRIENKNTKETQIRKKRKMKKEDTSHSRSRRQ